MDDHGLAYLGEDPRVNLGVVVGRARAGGERAARHQDDPAATALDRLALQRIGLDDVAHSRVGPGFEMIGARAAGDLRAWDRARQLERTVDQLERGGPVEAHPALCGIHRLGDAEAERPEVRPIGERRIPVYRGLQPGVGGRKRIGHDVCGRVGDAVETRIGRCWRPGRSVAQRVVVQRAVAAREANASHGPQAFSAGTSSQRRSAQLLRPSSASCTPFAPSSRFQRKGVSSCRWRMKSSHSTLNALS